MDATGNISVCVVALSLSCIWPSESDVPLFCDEASSCDKWADEHPTLTFCDIDGSVGGVGNRCIEPPGEPCMGDGMCTMASSPICDVANQVCRGCAEGGAGREECIAKDARRPACVEGQCVECGADSDCDASSPICDVSAQTCGLCSDDEAGDAACAARDSSAPFCGASGSCVECETNAACSEETPICEQSSGQCRGCATHEECMSEVCSDSGSCVSPDDIIYVDGATGADSAECGAQMSPCESIGGGVAKVDEDRTTVKVRLGLYEESVTIDSGKTMTVVGPASVKPPSGAPALLVEDGSKVTLDRFILRDGVGGELSDGVLCQGSGSDLRLKNSEVLQNRGHGVESFNCTIHIEQSTLSGNDGGGVSVTSGTLHIEQSTLSGNKGGGIGLVESDFTIVNNYIVSNGNATQQQGSRFGGVDISNSGERTQVFEFNTVADNVARTDADSSGVRCSTGPAVTARNNIVFRGTGSDSPALLDGNCAWTYSNIQGGRTGEGNIDMDPQFVDPAMGDFHLKSGSPCQNAADPAATVTVDIDGDTRPQGGRSDMGADEVPE